MIRPNRIIGRALAALLALGLWSASQAPAQTAPARSSGNQDEKSEPAPTGNQGMVDPARGPLEPVPPQAPAPDRQPPADNSAEPQPQQRTPLGTAVGQKGETAGGAASRPAGAAIAPAKQHQVRSMLVKLGAVAAAGVAVGTVVALSRGTSSNPPGASRVK